MTWLRSVKSWLEQLPELLGSDNMLAVRTCSEKTVAAVDMLAVDVSGSMNENDYKPTRLDGAKQAATHFVTRLREVHPTNLLGVVSFGSTAKVVSPPLCVAENITELKEAIRGLALGSSTNTGAGLRLTNNEIANILKVRDPRILLLTDGHANTGPDPEKTAEKVKTNGIQLDIIGIGGSPEDVNESQLKRMASVVNGELRYWFIRSVGELVQKFETLALREIK